MCNKDGEIKLPQGKNKSREGKVKIEFDIMKASFGIMRVLILCFAVLLSMSALFHSAESLRIHPGVFDKCKRPGGPHPGCHPNPSSPARPVNKYNRGCLVMNRCRGEDHNR